MKKVIVAVLLVSLCFSLTACGNSDIRNLKKTKDIYCDGEYYTIPNSLKEELDQVIDYIKDEDDMKTKGGWKWKEDEDDWVTVSLEYEMDD